MKAIRMHEKGGPELLKFEDAPRPELEAGDAMVRVFASAITKDELTWGPTYETKDHKSRLPVPPGHELSGVVKEVAAGVTDVKPGDAVYGLASFWRDGSAAEFIAIRAADLAPKPKTMDHVQAASVPLAALTAWQAMFDHAATAVARGSRVLIHGGAGGVGVFAVQLARGKGAEVIATGSAASAEFLRQIGASRTIDYTKERFEDLVRDVDFVLDAVGGDTVERSWSVLRRGGTLVSIVEPVPAERAAELGVKGVFFIVEPNRGELVEIARMIDAGALRTFVDSVWPLEQAREAFARGLTGHARGKIVLRVVAEAAAKA